MGKGFVTTTRSKGYRVTGPRLGQAALLSDTDPLFQVQITESFLNQSRNERLMTIDFSDNPIKCDKNVVEFVKITLNRKGLTTYNARSLFPRGQLYTPYKCPRSQQLQCL